ncbi:MAG: 2'-5' RNA ligase family protein [Planctomycetota bacterium]|jgi:2'-5' RNA ligase
MAEIAVDAVLLPPDEMTDKAIEANRELLQQCIGFPQGGFPGKIVLDKKNCLPHISLAMGCIDEKDIADIEKVLQTIAKQYRLEQLSVIDIHVGTSSAGEKVSVFQIEKTEALQSLHEEVMQRLAPYFSYDVTADMIFSRFPRSGVPAPEAGESTLLWIKNYPEKSSFENFFPHITIGYGEIDDYSFGSREAGFLPMRFTASKLALCHLGNHCTCRKILASAELRS